MRDVTSANFGLVIAYVIPGAGLLFSVKDSAPVVEQWFGEPSLQNPTVAGFMFVSLAAVAVGLTLSTLRWILLDSLHYLTGLQRPDLELKNLSTAFEAFHLLVEHKYRYYQFHGNSFIALSIVGIHELVDDALTAPIIVTLVATLVILFLGSRNTLAAYYSESERLLGVESPAESSKSETETP